MNTVVVADDHPITLLGTEAFLRTLNFKVIGSYHNGVSCLNGIVTLKPDLAIVDVSMPGISGLEIVENIKSKHLRTRVILLTMHRELSVVLSAREKGCDGYVLKDNAQLELPTCIEKVLQGAKYLSPELEGSLVYDSIPDKDWMKQLTQTEIKVLELVAAFKTNKEISEFLFIAEKTVESHKRSICEKLKLPKGKNVLLKWASVNMNKAD
ncbi:response regulator transcription factor [Bacteroidota bacterium]